MTFERKTIKKTNKDQHEILYKNKKNVTIVTISFIIYNTK